MAKFISQNNQVRFMMLLAEQTQNRTPCMSAVAVGVPENTDARARGLIPDKELDVYVPRISGARVLFVTADWSEDRQAYRITHIHCAGDRPRDESWTKHLHNIGWVTDKVNDRLWSVLGFRLRPNPVIVDVVQTAARERRVERRMQASALKYHLDQGVPQEEAIGLVLDASPKRPAKPKHTPKRKGYKNKPRRNFQDKPTSRNKHHNKPINRPFVGLNV